MNRALTVNRGLTAAGAVLAIAAAFAAWAGVQYASAAGAAAGGASPAARASALAAGTRELADLNTVSLKHLPASQGHWLADTAGGEHTEIEQTMSAAVAQIKKVKTSAAATVTDSALTALSVAPDGRTGTAGFIATVEVTRTSSSGGSDTVRDRYTATLTLTSAGWKISSLKGG